MVDLVDLEIHRLQGLGQALQKLSRARQALVVVAGFIEVIAEVHQLQLALLVAAHQVELGLQAGVESPSLILQALHLLLQHIAAVIGMWLAIDMPHTHHPPITWLPRHRRQRGQVASGHEVRTMGLHAHATDGKPGKTRALFGHRLQPADGHRLGLGRAMYIHKLSKHVLDPVLVDDALGFCWQHCSSLLAKRQNSVDGPN